MIDMVANFAYVTDVEGFAITASIVTLLAGFIQQIFEISRLTVRHTLVVINEETINTIGTSISSTTETIFNLTFLTGAIISDVES